MLDKCCYCVHWGDVGSCQVTGEKGMLCFIRLSGEATTAAPATVNKEVCIMPLAKAGKAANHEAALTLQAGRPASTRSNGRTGCSQAAWGGT